MCVPRHEVVPLLVSALDHDPDERDKACFYLADLFDQPEAHIRRHLIVPRPAGVQFPSQRAYQFAQAAFVGGVDVLIILLNLKLLVNQQSEGRGEEGRGETTWPLCHSFPTAMRPWMILLSSSLVTMPTRVNALAYAIEPRMSASYILWSYFND